MYCMFHIKANMLGKCLRSEKGTFCRKALSKLGNMTKDSYHSADKTYNIINSFFYFLDLLCKFIKEHFGVRNTEGLLDRNGNRGFI